MPEAARSAVLLEPVDLEDERVFGEPEVHAGDQPARAVAELVLLDVTADTEFEEGEQHDRFER